MARAPARDARVARAVARVARRAARTRSPAAALAAATTAPRPRLRPRLSAGGAAAARARRAASARSRARRSNAIDFPSFVASLIQGTFKAIVDASIQQMEAYAELLKNVAATVDRFMDDNVTDGQAKDYLADEHPRLFTSATRRAARRS